MSTRHSPAETPSRPPPPVAHCNHWPHHARRPKFVQHCTQQSSCNGRDDTSSTTMHDAANATMHDAANATMHDAADATMHDAANATMHDAADATMQADTTEQRATPRKPQPGVPPVRAAPPASSEQFAVVRDGTTHASKAITVAKLPHERKQPKPGTNGTVTGYRYCNGYCTDAVGAHCASCNG